MKNKLVKRKAEKEMTDIRTKVKKTNAVEEFIKKEQAKEENEEDFEGDYECPILKDQARRKEEIQKEMKALAKELRPKKKKEKKVDEEVEDIDTRTEEEKKNDVLASYHKEQKLFKAKKEAAPIPKQKASREELTLAMLAKFKNKLSGLKFGDEEDEEKPAEPAPKDDTAKKPDEDDDDEENYVGDDWMKNTLVFNSDAPVLAKDASTKDDDWFDIYDPRNPLNKRRREADASDGKKREMARMRRAL